MERDEQIAVEVLETIMNGNFNPINKVSTTMQNFTFTYEDLISDRKQAMIIKKRLLNDKDIIMFKKLRRRLLSRKYSKLSRTKKRTYAQIITSERSKIIEKAYELFADHPNMEEFREFIQTLNAEQTVLKILEEQRASNTIQEESANDVPDLVTIDNNSDNSDNSDNNDYSDDDVPDLIDTSKLQEIK